MPAIASLLTVGLLFLTFSSQSLAEETSARPPEAAATQPTLEKQATSKQTPAGSKFAQQNLEVRQRYRELEMKVAEQPEIKKMKEEAMAAQKAYAAAFEAALVKADAELVEQYKNLKVPRRSDIGKPGDKPAASAPPRTRFTDEQKAQLSAARQKAMENPVVKEARQKRNNAKDEEERKTAEAEYKAALDKAVLEINKDLAPLLEPVTVMKPGTEKVQPKTP